VSIDSHHRHGPTCIVVPAGNRAAVSIRGKDRAYDRGSGGKLSNFKNEPAGAATGRLETPPAGFTSCNILADDGFLEFGPSRHARQASRMTAN
jgi:hypothetical protein